MDNLSRINPVAERYTAPQRTQSEAVIDWKSIFLEIIRAFRNNSTFKYNGNDRTIEYEYHGREKQFKLSTSPAIQRYMPDEAGEE